MPVTAAAAIGGFATLVILVIVFKMIWRVAEPNEALIINREELTNQVRTSSADEMSKLGLIVDSLQIQEIEDDTNYISNLGRPHAAAVASAARIAEAGHNREATQAEQAADRENAGQV